MNAKLLALAILGASLLPAYAAGDAAQGEAVFKKCMACHAVGEGAANKQGPELNDLIGRVAGSLEGYKFSKAMTDAGAGGLVWTEESLAEFLASPKTVVPSTKMSFAGIKKTEDLDNIVAYLATFAAP